MCLKIGLTKFRVPFEEVIDSVDNSLAVVEGIFVTLDTEMVTAIGILVVLGLDVQFYNGVHWK